MGVGDGIELVERRHAEWTVERVQEYLHRDKGNLGMLREVCGLFPYRIYRREFCVLGKLQDALFR